MRYVLLVLSVFVFAAFLVGEPVLAQAGGSGTQQQGHCWGRPTDVPPGTTYSAPDGLAVVNSGSGGKVTVTSCDGCDGNHPSHSKVDVKGNARVTIYGMDEGDEVNASSGSSVSIVDPAGGTVNISGNGTTLTITGGGGLTFEFKAPVYGSSVVTNNSSNNTVNFNGNLGGATPNSATFNGGTGNRSFPGHAP